MLTDMIMGSETRRWSQSAELSPVQMGPMRCVPAKKARLSTKGLSPSEPNTALPLSTSPCSIPQHAPVITSALHFPCIGFHICCDDMKISGTS